MEPNFKLSRRQKTSLITRYLRHCWQYFVIGLVCACLGMTLNALTPQIIKITVDSILGEEATTLPLWVQNVIGWESLQQQPVRALWYAAVGVLLVALLRGVCSSVNDSIWQRARKAMSRPSATTCTGTSSI